MRGTTNALLGAFEVAGHGQGRTQMNDSQAFNRILTAAAAGNPQAQQLARLIHRGRGAQTQGYGYNQWGGPGMGAGNAGLGGYGVGRHAMGHGGRVAGHIAGSPGYGMGGLAGYGVGALPVPAGGGVPTPAASPLMGGFSPDPGATQIGWVDPNVTMGAPLGFDSGGTTLVAAGATFQLTSRPQEIFRGERFVIGSDIAPSLVVSDLKVGNRSQLINATNVPGMAFANTTIGASLRFETAQPGQDIVWSGINISGGSLRVLGTLFGSSAVRK